MATDHLKPIIAIDIDDVLFPFIVGVARYHNSLKGTSLTPADFVNFNLREVWGGTIEDSARLVDGFHAADHLVLEPVEGAQRALRRLQKDFTIVLVTARNVLFEPQTSRWLKHHFGGLFETVIFAGNPHDGRTYRSKGELCKQTGAVLLIDDHPNNLLSATESGLEGILFGVKTWSVMDRLPAASVRHCKDWEQTERYIYDEWRPKQLSR
ncbi:MAG: hypothetical protein ABI716_01240 [Candidatus Saccharibacteria bacterium]